MTKAVNQKVAKEKKPFTSTPLFFTLVAIFLGLLVSGIVLAIAGYNPFEAYWVILTGVFERPKYIAYTIIYSTPIIITGLSVAFAFKTGLFNIGAEGQFIVGALVATLVGVFMPMPNIIHPIVAILLAVLAGALWGMFSGYLKSRFGVNEVLSTIMLNWIAFYLNNLVISFDSVKTPLAPKTPKILNTASLRLLEGWKDSPEGIDWVNNAGPFADMFKADVNIAIILALILAVIIWFILNRTTLGYELRAVGFNNLAAEYGGINVKRGVVVSMGISGALAAFAGATLVLGFTKEVSQLSAMEGYGFDGMAVALIGNNNPFGCIAAGLLFGILKYGGPKIQNALGAPMQIINIMTGVIVFFTAMPNLIRLFPSFFKNIFSKLSPAGKKTPAAGGKNV